MGFNIGGFIEGAVVGFLETGNPYAAAAIGLYDGVTESSSQNTNIDSILQNAQESNSLNSLLNYAQLTQQSRIAQNAQQPQLAQQSQLAGASA